VKRHGWFAQAIVRQMHLDGIEGAPQILPIPPLNTLACRKASKFGFVDAKVLADIWSLAPDWEAALGLCLPHAV